MLKATEVRVNFWSAVLRQTQLLVFVGGKPVRDHILDAAQMTPVGCRDTFAGRL